MNPFAPMTSPAREGQVEVRRQASASHGFYTIQIEHRFTHPPTGLETWSVRRWAVCKAGRYLLCFALSAAACSGPGSAARAWKPLAFLTSQGCVNNDTMRARFDEALKSFTPTPTYSVVDLATLQSDDIRRGYPTPTILVAGADLFGMPAPTPPLPDPT